MHKLNIAANIMGIRVVQHTSYAPLSTESLQNSALSICHGLVYVHGIAWNIFCLGNRYLIYCFRAF
jgi:uncharacterized protein YunC (DUF1805 family)